MNISRYSKQHEGRTGDVKWKPIDNKTHIFSPLYLSEGETRNKRSFRLWILNLIVFIIIKKKPKDNGRVRENNRKITSVQIVTD